jgi:hypothetical protein
MEVKEGMKRRRKESMDRIEKDMTRMSNKKREKSQKLRKCNNIRCDGDDIPKAESNFSKMMNSLDRGLVGRIKAAGYVKPTAV